MYTHTHTLAGVHFKFSVSRLSVLEGDGSGISACVDYVEESPLSEDIEINIATIDDSAQGDNKINELLYIGIIQQSIKPLLMATSDKHQPSL